MEELPQFNTRSVIVCFGKVFFINFEIVVVDSLESGKSTETICDLQA